MFTIVKEMLMGIVPIPNIWIAQDNPDDPVLTFNTEASADAKVAELTAADITGRKFKWHNL